MKTKRDVAMLILMNKEGKFLLQHRAEHLERWPGIWGLFGGGIEEGETPEEGFMREIREELSYRVENPRLLLSEDFDGKYAFGKKYLFTCVHDESQEICLCAESQAYGWFNLDEIKNLKDTRIHESDFANIVKILENPKLYKL